MLCVGRHEADTVTGMRKTIAAAFAAVPAGIAFGLIYSFWSPLLAVGLFAAAFAVCAYTVGRQMWAPVLTALAAFAVFALVSGPPDPTDPVARPAAQPTGVLAPPVEEPPPGAVVEDDQPAVTVPPTLPATGLQRDAELCDLGATLIADAGHPAELPQIPVFGEETLNQAVALLEGAALGPVTAIDAVARYESVPDAALMTTVTRDGTTVEVVWERHPDFRGAHNTWAYEVIITTCWTPHDSEQRIDGLTGGVTIYSNGEIESVGSIPEKFPAGLSTDSDVASDVTVWGTGTDVFVITGDGSAPQLGMQVASALARLAS